MDKIQRAIEKFDRFNKSRKDYAEKNRCENPNFNDDLFDEFTKDIETAISAMKKQIPMKPVMKRYFEDIEEQYLCCPTCGEILMDIILGYNKEFYLHCLNCGQKFDWSEGNGVDGNACSSSIKL